MKLWRGSIYQKAIIVSILLLAVGTLSLTAGVLAYGTERTANLAGIIPGGAILRPFSGVRLSDASVSTDKPEYAPGQIVHITGAGFMGGENVQLRVVYVPGEKPANRGELPENVASGHDPWTISADGSGNITADWLVEMDSYGQTLLLTADGFSSGLHAETTFADNIGYNKGVYNKNDFPTPYPTGQAGVWTTGNAGSNYLEDQWVYYQYQAGGITAASGVDGAPTFDVTFNHYQSNTQAIFIDAFTNFRACVDCTEDSHTSGPMQGMLLDNKPFPAKNSVKWVNALPAISRINGTLRTNGVIDPTNGTCSALEDPVNAPSEMHCFHVDGPALQALFPGYAWTSGSGHTITLFYEAHLSNSFTWRAFSGGTGHEYLMGCSTSSYYVGAPDESPQGVFGTEAYSGGDPCAFDPATDWNTPFQGVGSATGSSRHFNITNQSAGSNGGLSLPIPTVMAPTGSLTIVKVTEPSPANGFTFGFHSDFLGDFNLDTDPSATYPNQTTFSGLPSGTKILVTEANVPADWNLKTLVCTGDATFTTDVTTRTASITLANVNGAVATCTYTNRYALLDEGRIIVKKTTIPASSDLFTFTPSYNNGTTFQLSNGQMNDSCPGVTPPLGCLPALPGGTLYFVHEAAAAGYDTSTPSVCTSDMGFPNSDANTITLHQSETVTCTFTNRKPDAKIAVSPLNATNAVGSPHTITATVSQDDMYPAGPPGDNANGFGPAPDGTLVTFTLLNNTAGATFVGGNTCNTSGGTGTCSVQINSSTAGGVDIHASTTFSVLGVSLTRSTGTGGFNSADAHKTYVDMSIGITPNTATNEVGHQHVFTVTVTKFPAGVPASGLVVTPSVLPVPGSISSNCNTAAFVGDVATCTITINSNSAGVFTANASATANLGNPSVSVTRATNGNSGPGGSGPATKTYVDARLGITPQTATNRVGEPHVITAFVEVNTGSGFTPAPAGTGVTFSLTAGSPPAAFVGSNSCTTIGATGMCSVTINSSTATSVTIHATTTVTVGGLPLTRTTGDGLSGDSADAHKTYVDARIHITPQTATNRVGEPHVITAFVEVDSGSGFVPAPAGTGVTFSLTAGSPPAAFVGSNSCTTVAATGMCTVTINSSTAASVTIHATTTVTVGGLSVTRSTGDGLSGDSADAHKTYVDARIHITPQTATNRVGEQHVITAFVEVNDGSGSGFVPAPAGTGVTFSLTAGSPPAAFVGSNSCTTVGATGMCTVTINSSTATSVTIHATTTVTVGGLPITRSTGDGLSGDSADAHKTYVDARIHITPLTATNEVRSQHVITAFVEVNTGSGFAPAPAGTGVTFSLTAGSPPAAFVGSNSCTTIGATGMCTVTINSGTATLVTIHATTTVTVGGLSVTRSTGDGLSGDSADAQKTYVDARINLSPLTATNNVQSPHTITATVEQNLGSGWGPAPNGTVVMFSLTAGSPPAFFVGGVSQCTVAGGAGMCSVTINSNSTTSVTIHATTSFTVGGLLLTRSTGDGLSGDGPDVHKDYVAGGLTLVKCILNDNGGTAQVGAFGITTSAGALTFGGGQSGSQTCSGGLEYTSNTLTNLVPGSKTLHEGTLAGYAEGTWSCSGAAGAVNGDPQNGSVVVGANENVVCRITNNDIAPRLHLRKIVINNNGGTKTVADFPLTADGTGANDLTGTSPVDSGAGLKADTWALSEVPQAGYSASGWVCVGGNQSGSNITLGLDQEATCTITNDDIAPRLHLRKIVINDNGGTATVADFPLLADGTGANDLSGTSPVDSGTGLKADTWALSETPNANYTASTWSCVGGQQSGSNITLGLDQEATCTITNDDIAPRLHLRKVIINNNGGTKTVADFPLTADGTGSNDLTGTSPVDSGGTLKADTWALSEVTDPNYTASAWVCVGGQQSGSNITLGINQEATCTITNDDKAPKLHLRKVVINDNGGTKTVADFPLLADGTGSNDISGTSPVDSGAGLKADTFALSETPQAGYTASAWVCVGGQQSGSNITLGLNQEATCTITNDDIAPRLHLRKVVINDNGGTKTVADFPLLANGTGTNDISGTSPVDSGPGLKADTFALSETPQAGYSASAWVCVGGNQSGSNITLGLNQEATCTITNDDNPAKIIIRKFVLPSGASGSFAFNATGSGYAGFSLSGGQQNMQTLVPGSYSAMEMVPLGWMLTGIGTEGQPGTQCTVSNNGGLGSGTSTGSGDLGTQTVSIVLQLGDTVTCDFENTAAPSSVTRTQGFWATHPNLAQLAWNGGTGLGHTFPGVTNTAGIGDKLLCGREVTIPNLTVMNSSSLMGGFWSDISKKSNASKRTAIDQDRMKLLQQLLAAELNGSAFGSVPATGSFAAWEAAFCTGTDAQINTAQQQAGNFNTAGDNGTFTPGTNADSQLGRFLANRPFWDIPNAGPKTIFTDPKAFGDQ